MWGINTPASSIRRTLNIIASKGVLCRDKIFQYPSLAVLHFNWLVFRRKQHSFIFLFNLFQSVIIFRTVLVECVLHKRVARPSRFSLIQKENAIWLYSLYLYDMTPNWNLTRTSYIINLDTLYFTTSNANIMSIQSNKTRHFVFCIIKYLTKSMRTSYVTWLHTLYLYLPAGTSLKHN